jgi:hypothetical protein
VDVNGREKDIAINKIIKKMNFSLDSFGDSIYF